jgi:hypothetical protein
VVRAVEGQVEEVVVGFEQDVYGEDPAYQIGPLGLAFLAQDALAVGGGDLPDGQEQLRVFRVPPAGSEPIKADAALASFSLAATDRIKGEGDFYGLAATRKALYVTCNGDDARGWIGRAEVKDGAVVSFQRFIATKEATGVDAPAAVTISPRGEVVIGQMGEMNEARDSLLTFYNALNGRALLNLETGLYDITALAYSPDGQLYATDFASKKTNEGGLFQLISTIANGKQAVMAKKIVALDRPTAMAFGKDGALYVTVFGTAEQGSDRKPGRLLKIAL